MPTKGWDISIKEKRGRSPLLPRKLEIGQQIRIPNPPTLERKNGLPSAESRKIPIYDKHTVSSSIYARSSIKHPFVDNTKLAPQSKVMSIRSKFNEKKVTNPNMTIGSTKSKDVRTSHTGNKPTRQPTNSFETRNPRLSNVVSSSKDSHIIITHEEDDKATPFANSGAIMISENCNTRSVVCEDDVISNHEDESMDIEHIDDDHGDEINQQDQPDASSDHDQPQKPRSEVDQEDQEDEQGVQEDVEHEEMGPEEPEPEPKEEPKEEECGSTMVEKNHEVVAHGKKETAAYKYVIEGTLSELQQQRVKALVGVFETIISLECDALQKSIKQC